MTLADWAAAEQDPELFPYEVRSLYESGRILAAHAALKRHVNLDRSRAEQRRAALRDLDLWVEPLPPGTYPRPGFGRSVIESKRHGDKWIVTTAGFLGTGGASWLCTGSHLQGCTGRVPLQKSTTGTALLHMGVLAFIGGITVLPIVTAVVLFVGLTPVWIVNGNGVPVTVEIDGEPHTVAPHSAEKAGSLFVGEHTIGAYAGDHALGAAPVTLDWGLKQLTINPNERAVLYTGEIWYSVYQFEEPPFDTYAGTDFLTVTERIDYPFEEPPDEIYTSSSGTDKRSLMYDLQNEEGWEDQAVEDVFEQEGFDAALDYTQRALELEPQLPWARDFLVENDPETARALSQHILEEDMSVFENHVWFQEAWDRFNTTAYYETEWAYEESALNAYFLARSLPRGDDQALWYLERAGGLDRGEVGVERALRLADEADYAGAFEALDGSLEQISASARADQVGNWLKYGRLAGAELRVSRFDWMTETMPNRQLFYKRMGAIGQDPGPLVDPGDEAFRQVVEGNLVEAWELMQQAGPFWGTSDLEAMLAASDGSPYRELAFNEEPRGQAWTDVFRFAIWIQDRPDQVDPSWYEDIPSYVSIAGPEPSIRQLDREVAQMGWVLDRFYTYAGWGVRAEDPALRRHCREQARRYILPDERPYWE